MCNDSALAGVLIPGVAALGSTCYIWGGKSPFHSTTFATTVSLGFFTLSMLLASLPGGGINTYGCC